MISHVDDGFVLEDALLETGNRGLYTGDGSLDRNGNPILKHNTGNWKACYFILGTDFCERLVFYGIGKNLVAYLTGKLHEGNVSAARKVTNWQGTSFAAPLIGAYLADAYWGRYWTVAVFSTVYLVGMSTLTLSASIPALKPPACEGFVCPPPTLTQNAIFFFGLYLVALGTGGMKPCVSAFGADQFDDTDSTERPKKGSFFNWFYFCSNIGALIATCFIVWIQDNAGWVLGFGIPTLFMGIAIASFFSGTPLYRFQKPGGSPLVRMCQVLVASFRKWNVEIPHDSSRLYELPDKASAIKGSRKVEHSDELKCLDKAAVLSDCEVKSENFPNPWRLCTVTQVEELKIIICIFPILVTGIIFSTAIAQMSTMFVEQGMVMDSNLGSFIIPPASLSTFCVISVILWVPIYDKLLVPVARRFTGKKRGISQLQRIGIGLFVATLALAAAAMVEIKRLEVARALVLVETKVAVPISILWQIPQYALLGWAEVFTIIGNIEFFYDQSPDAMRTICSAWSLLSTGLGNYLNSLILTIVTTITTNGGKPGWVPDNLNEGHLDYFFWLLTGLNFLSLLAYVFCASKYKYRKAS